MIRVLITGEIYFTCSVIAAALKEQPDIEVIGCVTTVEETVMLAQDCDLVLVNVIKPNPNALNLIQVLSEATPSVRIVAVGLIESTEAVLRYIEAGISGYVRKEDSVDQLLKSIRAVYRGEALVSPQIAAILMKRLAELKKGYGEYKVDLNTPTNLTRREREVIELVRQGYSNREIADRLVIEIGTVKNHVHNLLRKLDVNSRRDIPSFLALIEE